ASQFENNSYLLFDRRSFASFSVGDLSQIKNAIEDVHQFYYHIKEMLSKNLNASPDIEQLIALGERMEDLKMIVNTISEKDLFQNFKRMLLEKSNETSSLWLSNIERLIIDCFADVGPETSVPTALLGAFQKALHRAMKARKGLFSWLRWQLFSKDKIMITRALVANQLQSDKQSFKILEQKLDQRLNFEHNLSKLKNKKWLLSIPEEISKSHFEEWFIKQQETIRAKTIYNSIRGLKNLLNPINLKEGEFHSKTQMLIQVLEQVKDKIRIWSSYLSNAQIEKLSNDSSVADKLMGLLSHDFDSLCEFDRLKRTLSESELQIVQKLKEKSGRSGA